MRPSIELVMYVRDEAKHLSRAIESVRRFVDSFAIWDTGSTDGTLEIARAHADRLYTLRVPDEAVHFGELETMIAHLGKADWVLRLDGDETLEGGEVLRDLASDPLYGAWAFPRYRWADLGMTVQLEREAFPDWQYRFMRNDGRSRYVDALHPHFESTHSIGRTQDVFFHHFVDPLHLSDPERVARRGRLYERLAREAGKLPEGSGEAMRLAGAS